MKAAFLIGTVLVGLVGAGFFLGLHASGWTQDQVHGACLQVTDSTKLCLVPAE